MSYFNQNPIQNKAIAHETEKVFCKDYNTRIRYACAVSSNGNKILHLEKKTQNCFNIRIGIFFKAFS